MLFDVRVSFTGICAFIPNANKGEDVKVRMCVVLPDGRERPVPDEPGKFMNPYSYYDEDHELRRHRSFMSFWARNLEGGSRLSGRLLGVVDLSRHRVVFKCSGEDNPVDVDAYEALDKVARLDEAIPSCGVNPDVLGPAASYSVAQVLIDKGSFSYDDPKQSWVFPNFLSEKPLKSRPLTNMVSLSLKSLSAFAVRLIPMDGGIAENWNFQPGVDGLSINIVNLCDDNPLRWPDVGVPVTADRDFEWYYELIDNPGYWWLKLKKLPWPVPHPVDTQGNGRGVNCIPALMPEIGYDLDGYLEE